MVNLENNIKALIAQQFDVPIDEVTTNANLKTDFTVDDLRKSQMVTALREKFDIYVDEEDKDQFATTQDVINYVETKLWWYSL